jgi:DNA-nicking Smr family endonuclease
VDYKEGVDYKLVPAKDTKGNIVKDSKGNPVKTRKFFTKAEKAAMKAPKAVPKAAPKAAPKATKPKEKPVAKDAMKGYRREDVTTTSLDKPKGGRGDGAAEVKRRNADAKPKGGRGDGVAEVKRRNELASALAYFEQATRDAKPTTRKQTAAEKAYERDKKRAEEAARKYAEFNAKYPETTNPLILGARSIRNLFSSNGGLGDRKKR